MEKSKTFAWQYFSKCCDNDEAKCNHCGVIIKCKGFSTSGLLRHLKAKHSIEKPTSASDCSLQSSAGNQSIASSSKCLDSLSSQPTLFKFLKKDSKEEIIAKLVAVDGFPINAICKSEFIQQAFSEKGFLLPKNPNHVMQLVYKQYNIIK